MRVRSIGALGACAAEIDLLRKRIQQIGPRFRPLSSRCSRPNSTQQHYAPSKSRKSGLDSSHFLAPRRDHFGNTHLNGEQVPHVPGAVDLLARPGSACVPPGSCASAATATRAPGLAKRSRAAASDIGRRTGLVPSHQHRALDAEHLDSVRNSPDLPASQSKLDEQVRARSVVDSINAARP